MFKSVRRHTLIVFTLLAMLSQALLSNGFAMATEMHETMMSACNHVGVTSTEYGAACHTELADNCCNSDLHTQALPGASQNCCDGDGQCEMDCSHCQAVSVTGTLYNAKSWSGFSPSELSSATQMPHFYSVSLTKVLRPPIV